MRVGTTLVPQFAPGKSQRASASPFLPNQARLERGLDLQLQVIALDVQEVFTAAAVAIALAEDGEGLVCRAAVGTLATDVGCTISGSTGLAAACLRSGHLEFSGNAVSDHRIDPECCRQLGIRSIAVVPIFTGDSFRGILQVCYSKPYAFGKHELKRLEDAGERVAEQIRASEKESLPVSTNLFERAQSCTRCRYCTAVLIVLFIVFAVVSATFGYFAALQASHVSTSSIQRVQGAK